MVVGGDSFSSGREFESQHPRLGGQFFVAVKIELFV